MSAAHSAATRASRCASRARSDADRPEAHGRSQQQPGRIASVAPVQSDLPAQDVHLRELPDVHRASFDGHQHPQSRIKSPGVGLGPRCLQQSLGAASRVGSQQRRALQECGRSGHAPAAPCPVRGGLELVGDCFVGSRGRVGQVPCPTVRIQGWVCHRRQGPVQLTSLWNGCGAVGARTHQRMPELNVGPELDEPGVRAQVRRPLPRSQGARPLATTDNGSPEESAAASCSS